MHRNRNSEAGNHLLDDRQKFEHDARNQIRKQALDPYNRLHSIAEDIKFVQDVHEKYSTFPLIANLRCGAWYCDSRSAGGTTAHFKSADGHYNGWGFNLRRPNVHILPLIRDTGGICLVDSTRSGKRLPDSLSKTVPIWCSVINRALLLRRSVQSDTWDIQLYTPPQSVSRQEHTQIERRIDGWANALAKSTYHLPNLEKPLRPIWITPVTTLYPEFNETTEFLPIICISASKFIEDGIHRRRHGYSYVQGAGDDHENWCQGLTPEIFWKHRDRLLHASGVDFPSVLESVVRETHSISHSLGSSNGLTTPIAYVGGAISISTIDSLPGSIAGSNDDQTVSREPTACIIVTADQHRTECAKKDVPGGQGYLYEVTIPKDKKAGERAFKASLSGCLSFIRRHIGERSRVHIACETGKDLSVGIALAALQSFFDDNGGLHLERFDQGKVEVSKESLRTRLHWIIASRPEANPSRSTLKRINEFFMSPRSPGV